MTSTDLADAAAAYKRLKTFVVDMQGMGRVRNKTAEILQAELKAALLNNGGLPRVKELVGRMFREDVLTKLHWKNLLIDLETMKKAEF